MESIADNWPEPTLQVYNTVRHAYESTSYSRPVAVTIIHSVSVTQLVRHLFDQVKKHDASAGIRTMYIQFTLDRFKI